MDFFAEKEDAVRVAEYILDCIGLDLPKPLAYISSFWEHKRCLVPVVSKMPFVLTLYWDLFCSAGIVIEKGLGISTYKRKFDAILKDRNSQLAQIKETTATIPSSAPEIYRSLRPVYHGEEPE